MREDTDYLQLITILEEADRQMYGRAEIGPLRETVIGRMESAIISRKQIEAYLRTLQTVVHSEAPYTTVDTDALLPDILEHGFGCLPDHELVRLCLNPVALSTLRLCVIDQFPDYWSELMAKAAQQKM